MYKMIRDLIKLLFVILIILRELFFKIRFISGHLIIKLGRFLKIEFLSTYNSNIPIKNIKKILIFRSDRIGDLVLTTPAIANIREYFRNAKIDIVINSYTYDIMENNPDVDNIILKDKYSKKEFIKLIKKQKYDLAVILFSDIKDKRIAFKSRIPYRIGSNRDGGGYLLTHYIKDTRKELAHEVQACFDIIKILNIPIKHKSLILKPSDKYRKKVIQIHKKFNLKQKKFIVVHPYSRDPKMRWPEDYYKLLLEKLIKLKSYKIVLIGSKSEAELTKNLIKEITPKPINLAGMFTLGELIYFLKDAAIFIGNSTGTMHIANALNVPVITVFGSHYIRHHYKRWYPWNPGGQYLIAEKICKICMPYACNMECMKTIPPESVYNKVMQILNK